MKLIKNKTTRAALLTTLLIALTTSFVLFLSFIRLTHAQVNSETTAIDITTAATPTFFLHEIQDLIKARETLTQANLIRVVANRKGLTPVLLKELQFHHDQGRKVELVLIDFKEIEKKLLALGPKEQRQYYEILRLTFSNQGHSILPFEELKLTLSERFRNGVRKFFGLDQPFVSLAVYFNQEKIRERQNSEFVQNRNKQAFRFSIPATAYYFLVGAGTVALNQGLQASLETTTNPNTLAGGLLIFAWVHGYFRFLDVFDQFKNQGNDLLFTTVTIIQDTLLSLGMFIALMAGTPQFQNTAILRDFIILGIPNALAYLGVYRIAQRINLKKIALQNKLDALPDKEGANQAKAIELTKQIQKLSKRWYWVNIPFWRIVYPIVTHYPRFMPPTTSFWVRSAGAFISGAVGWICNKVLEGKEESLENHNPK